MSSGDKKPGLKDISDLKARLGMLNKGAGGPAQPAEGAPKANPFAPKTSGGAPSVDLTDDPDVMVGGDTAVVRIEPRARQEEPAAPAAEPAAKPIPRPSFSLSGPPKATPAPASAPPPPAGGFALGSAEDLFKKKEPEKAPPEPPARPAANQGPAVDPFGDSQKPAPPPEPPSGIEVANPLQVGRYNEAVASVNLSAEEEEALASFEGKQRGIKPTLAIAMTVAVGVITLVFGYGIGNSLKDRKLVNAQIDASIQVKKHLEPLLDQVRVLIPVIVALAANKEGVDWEKMEMIPEDLPRVDAGVILSTGIPLSPDLSRSVTNAVADINELFGLVREHRRITLGRDKAELKAIEEDQGWAKYDHFAVLYTPVPPETGNLEYVPPKGRVVAVVGKYQLNEAGDDRIMPVKTREAEDARQVSLRQIIALDKSDLILSGSANAHTLYQKRLEAIVVKMKAVEGYQASLRDLLAREASRSKVFSL